MVSIETDQAEEAKEKIDKFICENEINSKIPNLRIKQGAKNKNKWAWSVTDTLYKTESELVDWFANTSLLFYHSFEQHGKWEDLKE